MTFIISTFQFHCKSEHKHGTITRTRITFKSFVIRATQLAGALLLKMLKYFEVMLKVFELSQVKEIVEPWLFLGNIIIHESSNEVS